MPRFPFSACVLVLTFKRRRTAIARNLIFGHFDGAACPNAAKGGMGISVGGNNSPAFVLQLMYISGNVNTERRYGNVLPRHGASFNRGIVIRDHRRPSLTSFGLACMRFSWTIAGRRDDRVHKKQPFTPPVPLAES